MGSDVSVLEDASLRQCSGMSPDGVACARGSSDRLEVRGDGAGDMGGVVPYTE